MTQKKKTITKKPALKNICEPYIHESEEQYRQLVELSQDAIVLIDHKGVFRIVNPSACSLFGYSSEEEMVGLSVLKTYLPEEASAYAKRLKQIKLGESPRFERKALRKDGKVIDVEVSTTPMDHKRYQAIIRDITDRKNLEQQTKRQQHVLSIISDSNEALIRISDEKELLNEICRIAVEDNGYLMAWIGYTNYDKTKTVQPMAHYGFEKGYVEKIKIEWGDTPRGQGPTGTAIRTGKPFICQNMLTDPKFSPWRKDALARGYQSSIALPLKIRNKIWGALNIYSPEKDSFQEDEVKLLTKLANNLAFGIDTIRTRNEARKAEEKYSTVVEKSNDGIIIMQDGLLKYVNSVAAEMTGYKKESVLEKPFIDFVSPEYKKIVLERYKKRLGGQKVPSRYEIEILSKNGLGTLVEINASQVEYEGRPAVMAIVRDITKKRAAENALRESEEKFRALFESAKAGIFLLDMEGKIVDLNKSFAQMHGYTMEELLKMGLKELDTPETAKLAPERMRRLLSGEPMSFDVEHYRKDGSILPLNASANLVTIGGKKYVLGFHHDITERKKTEKEFRRIFDESPVGIVTVGLDLKYIKVNKTFCEFVGYSEEELLQLDTKAVTHPDHLASDLGKVKKLMVGETPMYKTEKRYIKKNGDTVWGLTTVRLVKEDNDKQYFLGTIENITYRKLADEQLMKKVEEINSFFDITLDLLCISDSSGKLLRLNKSWEKILGYSTQELLGKNLIDFVHPEDKEITRKALNVATQTPLVDFKNRYLCKNGSYRMLEWRSRPVGGIVYSTARDITERKEEACETPKK